MVAREFDFWGWRGKVTAEGIQPSADQAFLLPSHAPHLFPDIFFIPHLLHRVNALGTFALGDFFSAPRGESRARAAPQCCSRIATFLNN